MKHIVSNIIPISLKKPTLLLRIFYFLSDFSDENKLHIADVSLTEQEREIAHRFLDFKDKVANMLGEFYEEVERFKRTGEFEIIWDEFISDSNDQ